MKKIMTMMLGLTLVLGTASMFGQATPAPADSKDTTTKTKKVKKSKKAKKTDDTKMAPAKP